MGTFKYLISRLLHHSAPVNFTLQEVEAPVDLEAVLLFANASVALAAQQESVAVQGNQGLQALQTGLTARQGRCPVRRTSLQGLV